jgi:hypothetical protein
MPSLNSRRAAHGTLLKLYQPVSRCSTQLAPVRVLEARRGGRQPNGLRAGEGNLIVKCRRE